MKFGFKLATAVAAATLVTGCSMLGGDDDKRIADLETELESTQASLEQERAAKENLERKVTMMATEKPMAADGGADLPPNAKPGHCYARVLIPAQYQTMTERVEVQPAAERVETTPAQYGTDTQRILVQEESERIEVVPATYKTVTERVMVQPERRELVPTAAKFETRTERVLVREGYTTWKKGRGPIERIDAATGEIMCLVEVPPEYRTVKKRVQVAPASTREVVQPAEFRTVTKRVVDRPASTRTVKIPAKYRTVTVRKVVQPAGERRVAIPAQYADVTKRKKVTDSRLEWREILCDTNTTGDVVARLQRALKAQGFNPGPIDGDYGPKTSAAVQAYQRKAGLPTGALTIRTLNSLGVSLGRSA